jgi:lysophospholipase L1-like esterase
MRNILIVGDSLAGGLPHLSFPALMEKALEDCELTVNSMGGDTIAGIGARARELAARMNPDVVVLEGGGNDIGLPFLKMLGGNWKRLVERVEKRGSRIAADAADFGASYEETLKSIGSGGARVVITTIGCIGEDLSNGLNKLREEYNEVIRELAARHGAGLADVGKKFEEILSRIESPSQYILGRYRDAFLDTPRMLTSRRAMRLSGKRGLVLTVDGCHNNPEGAMIYAQTIMDAMSEGS